MNVPDIFFDDRFCRIFAERDGYPYECVHYEDKNGSVLYPLMKREIVLDGQKTGYIDTVTPYAFGGPIVLNAASNVERANLLDAFRSFFKDYCQRERIVAEYVQFNPWLRNHLDFSEDYELSIHNKIFGIDLSVGDFFMKEFAGRRRTSVRSAEKAGVDVQFDEAGDSLDDFLRIYDLTIERNNIREYFHFSAEFLNKLFQRLKGEIFCLRANYEKRCISVCIILVYKDFIHYLYAANDPNYFKLNASSLLIYKAACYGQEMGCKMMNLGGGGNEHSRLFKESFTRKTTFDYFTGTRIHNDTVYNELTRRHGVEDVHFFPAYRAPKKNETNEERSE